ncbi:MAG: hypothetical protein GY884_08060, partial [Proteobacteria bacterium]|nr:hypothetical protein [Pseudomonadota bacterium]
MLTLLCGVFLGCTVEEPELPPAAPPTSSEAPPPGASAKVAAPTTETFTPVRGAGTPPAETSGDEKDVSGPWVQGLRLATSTDGLAFSSAGEWIAD